MKKRVKAFLIVAIIVVATGVGYGLYMMVGEENAPVDESTQILTVEANPGTVAVRVEGRSVVEPYLVQDIRAKISATITRAPLEGDLVSSGSMIVGFDATNLETAVKQARLNLEQTGIDLKKAVFALEKARKDLLDKKLLAEQGAIAASQVSAAEETLANAELAIESSEVRLQQMELTLEKAIADLAGAVVTAPFSGVVLSSNVKAGDTVGSGSVLFTLADVSRVRLTAEVDEYDIGKIEPGMAVTVTSDAVAGETLKSKVERISPAAEIVNNISIFKVSTVLRNGEGLLRPGMSADVSILIRSDKGVIVPSKTVSTVRGRSYVDVYENGEVATRRITIGADDGVNTAVLEGLEDGAVVVLPATASFTLTSGSVGAATSIVPITVPGTGGSR